MMWYKIHTASVSKMFFTKNYEISVQIKDNFMPSALRQTRPMPNFTSGAEIWDYSPETILSINLPELRIVCTISTKFSASFTFLPRDAMQAPKRGLCRHAVSVCVSVTFVHLNGMAIFQREPPPPNGGVECRWGRQKSLF